MKAAYLTETGGPEVIQYGDLPTPEPRANEIRVKVAASSVNPIDTYIRSGMVAMPLPKPFIPGCDFAGTVDAVGRDVKGFKTGDRVWGSNQGLLGRQGCFAEYACVAEEWVYPLAANLPFENAAAVALVGITASLGLFTFGELKQGETVFVSGGTGGVGAMVVQMAKAAGATVFTSCGSPEKTERAKKLGADFVVDYKAPDFAEQVKKAGPVQLWYETHKEHDLARTIDLLAPNGRLIVMAGRASKPILPVGPFYVKGLTMKGFAMFNRPAIEQRGCAERINALLPKLDPNIGVALPLEKAAFSHRIQETGKLEDGSPLAGKIVVRVG